MAVLRAGGRGRLYPDARLRNRADAAARQSGKHRLRPVPALEAEAVRFRSARPYRRHRRRIHSSHRPMAVAAPDDGGAGRDARQGRCRRDRLRRPLLREGSAERRRQGLRRGRGPQRRRHVALSGTRRRRRGLRPCDRGSPGCARRVPHPDPQWLAGEPHGQGWLLLHRRPAQSVPRQVQRRARADPRAGGKRDGARLSQLAAGQRPRRPTRAAASRRQRPDPAESRRWRRCASPRAPPASW